MANGGLIGVENKLENNKASGVWTLEELFRWTTAKRWPRLTYTIEYLIIGGGGGAGGNNGAGGGAGGYRCSVFGESSGGGSIAEPPLTVIPLTEFNVIVGAGGPANESGTGMGGISQLGNLFASGGGGGGSGGTNATNGGPGGSGGGAAAFRNWSPRTGGIGTANQGFSGGNAESSGNNQRSSGGGGAGGAGGISPAENVGGIGGVGLSSNIDGTNTIRAVGGSGYLPIGTSPGVGTLNSGSGGSYHTGGNLQGESGIVIIRYLGIQQGTGGIVTTVGNYTVHTFKSSGIFIA
jgi:hypothetical protein